MASKKRSRPCDERADDQEPSRKKQNTNQTTSDLLAKYGKAIAYIFRCFRRGHLILLQDVAFEMGPRPRGPVCTNDLEHLLNAHNILRNIALACHRNMNLQDWLRGAVLAYPPGLEDENKRLYVGTVKLANAALERLDHPEDIWAAHVQQTLGMTVFAADVVSWCNKDKEIERLNGMNDWEIEEGEKDQAFKCWCEATQSSDHKRYKLTCWCGHLPRDAARDERIADQLDRVPC